MSDHYGFETLATTLEDGILRVEFNRPDRLNALNALPALRQRPTPKLHPSRARLQLPMPQRPRLKQKPLFRLRLHRPRPMT